MRAAWGARTENRCVFWMVVNAFSIAITTFVGQIGTRQNQTNAKKCAGGIDQNVYNSAILLSGLLSRFGAFVQAVYQQITGW